MIFKEGRLCNRHIPYTWFGRHRCALSSASRRFLGLEGNKAGTGDLSQAASRRQPPSWKLRRARCQVNNLQFASLLDAAAALHFVNCLNFKRFPSRRQNFNVSSGALRGFKASPTILSSGDPVRSQRSWLSLARQPRTPRLMSSPPNPLRGSQRAPTHPSSSRGCLRPGHEQRPASSSHEERQVDVGRWKRKGRGDRSGRGQQGAGCRQQKRPEPARARAATCPLRALSSGAFGFQNDPKDDKHTGRAGTRRGTNERKSFAGQ
ncbi:uncharacterized protein LOC116787405 [Chiroxiphia lanceolata]|uniref:uncharacterized protein LOC116787405 n=1 Tax=Chiroxiphia lanceolata TaxID=296741 RepID=UPI0013CEB0E2|nr:uncharacterized protein LOC116787405 [Chiroxiphia lanceolata]